MIDHISWTTSQAANVELFSYAPETSLSAFPIYAEKIKGFNLVRGTAVFRFVLNAEPFHAGKLLASFIPVAQQLANLKWRQCCLNQKSQQPCVELDCRDAVAVMKIPYIAPTDYYEPASDTIGWGLTTLSVLSPLTVGSAGSNNVKVSVFIHFEDFELAAPLYPQSGAPSTKRTPRPLKSFSGSIQDRESDIMAHGTVSKGLMLLSQVAEKATGIPMLAAIAQPASWVSRGLAHVASWFGWSKPNLHTTQEVTSRRLVPNMANSTGATTAPMLALYHDNKVDIMPSMAGNGMDECSFDYLKMRKAFCRRFTMSTVDAENQNLFFDTVRPDMAQEQVAFVGTTVSNVSSSYAPFAYLSRYFQRWRGGIRMHVKIAKTDYHSGRISIVYSPSTGALLSPPSNTDATYSMREIIDIRGKSEFVLDLPYLINTPYIGSNESMGEIQIRVLNELKAPETCQQSIEFLVYYSACEDFELQVPGSVRTPLPNTPYRALPFYPQGGTQADVNQEIIEEVMGNYPKPSFSLEPSRTCMGEVFTSVKQLLNRYSHIASFAPLANGVEGYQAIYPFFMGGIYSEPVTGDFDLTSVFGDAISNIAPGYAFYRGGVRIHANYIINNQPTIQSYAYNVRDSLAVTPIITSLPTQRVFQPYGSPFLTSAGDNVAMQVNDGLGHCELSIPYQNKTHMTIIDPYDQIAGNMPTGYSNPTTVAVVGSPSLPSIVAQFKRSASDEFQLAYFLGFPLVLQSAA